MHKNIAIMMLVLVGAISGISFAEDKPAEFTFSVNSMASESDLIALGTVDSITQDQSRTLATIRVLEVFKDEIGAAAERGQIKIASDYGKVMVDTDAPQFFSHDRAFLFLKKEEGRDVYRCIGGKMGKQSIIHDNVYVNPSNNFARVKYEKYYDHLKETLLSAADEAKVDSV